jgi:hypothetical protein
MNFYEILNESVESSQNEKHLNDIQLALDIIGVEPTTGTVADIINVLISSLRAAYSKENDQRKKHIINAAISAISIIPFADIVKLLKLKKTNKKIAVSGARKVKDFSKSQKIKRFQECILTEGHRYKLYDKYIELARELGCSIKETKKGHIIRPPDDVFNAAKLPLNLRQWSFDRGDKAIYPIARYLRRFYNNDNPLLNI